MSQSAARHARRHEPMSQPPPEIARALEAAQQQPAWPPKQVTYPAVTVNVEKLGNNAIGLVMVYPPTGQPVEVMIVPFDQRFARNLAARLLAACDPEPEPAGPSSLIGPNGGPLTQP